MEEEDDASIIRIEILFSDFTSFCELIQKFKNILDDKQCLWLIFDEPFLYLTYLPEQTNFTSNIVKQCFFRTEFISVIDQENSKIEIDNNIGIGIPKEYLRQFVDRADKNNYSQTTLKIVDKFDQPVIELTQLYDQYEINSDIPIILDTKEIQKPEIEFLVHVYGQYVKKIFNNFPNDNSPACLKFNLREKQNEQTMQEESQNQNQEPDKNLKKIMIAIERKDYETVIELTAYLMINNSNQMDHEFLCSSESSILISKYIEKMVIPQIGLTKDKNLFLQNYEGTTYDTQLCQYILKNTSNSVINE